MNRKEWGRLHFQPHQNLIVSDPICYVSRLRTRMAAFSLVK